MPKLSVKAYRQLWALHHDAALFHDKDIDYSELIQYGIVDFETGKITSSGEEVINLLEQHAAPLLSGRHIKYRHITHPNKIFDNHSTWHTFSWRNQSLYLDPKGRMLVVGNVPIFKEGRCKHGIRSYATIPGEMKTSLLKIIKPIEDPKRWIQMQPFAFQLEAIGGRTAIILRSVDKTLLAAVDAIYFDYLRKKYQSGSLCFLSTELPNSPLIMRGTSAYTPTINTYSALIAVLQSKSWNVDCLNEEAQEHNHTELEKRGMVNE